VGLSEPQGAAIAAATLAGEKKDETLYRLIRLSQTACDESIKPIPVGTTFIPAEGRRPAREKRLIKAIRYSGQLHPNDDSKLSDLVDSGKKAQDILEAWFTCGAQVPQPGILHTAEEFYAWLAKTYPLDGKTSLEDILFDAWGRLSYKSAIAWLDELSKADLIYLYAWPAGQKTLIFPGGRYSWLEFKPRYQL
jgi:hypothetical protein